jgi:predicted metal-dependent RNase
MAEAILTIDPKRLDFLKELTAKITVKDKKFDLYSNTTAWKIVKQRITARLPEVSEEDIENFKGKRAEFIKHASQKTGKQEETVDMILEECGWTKTEEIPPFLRQIGP